MSTFTLTNVMNSLNEINNKLDSVKQRLTTVELLGKNNRCADWNKFTGTKSGNLWETKEGSEY